MANPWKKRAFAFNLRRAQERAQAADMHKVARHIARIPYGQLKKLMDDELLAIFRKYGITE